MKSDTQTQFEISSLTPILRNAGHATLQHFRSSLTIENKAGPGDFDPVTQADKMAESIIREGLARQFPEHAILGEEFGGEIGDGWTWIIDPIDGTRSFMSGMLHWGILLGLYENGEPRFGAMYQPFTDELFWGDSKTAHYQRGEASRELRVSPCEGLAAATLAATGPDMFAADELPRFNAVQQAARQVRFGGDCYLYSLIAMGQIDIGVEASLQPYDIAALIPIVEGAGGIVTNWEGGSAALGGQVVAAGDHRVHDAVLKLLAP